jgi:hypothetical protein
MAHQLLVSCQRQQRVDIHECSAIWSMFPELDLSMKVNLDEPDFIFEGTEGGMDDPPF